MGRRRARRASKLAVSASTVQLVYVSHSFPPPGRPSSNVGGMQRVAVELFHSLSSHPEVIMNPVVLRTSWRWTHVRTVPFFIQAYHEISRKVKRDEIDIVLFSSMVTAALSIPLRKHLNRSGVKTAAIAHGRDITLPVGVYQRFLPTVFDSVDAVLPVSRATGEACLERGLSREKLHVVPNGVDLDRFSIPLNKERERRELWQQWGLGDEILPENTLVLCSVGRQVERKGFAWFIDEVMPLLPDNIHYWLVGEGPEREHIQTATVKRGLMHRVRLLGRVPDTVLLKVYRSANLFIMPNTPIPGDMEGFGVVMLEAGLCGLPTVASNLEGIRDVVQDQVNGHLVPARDAAAFADVIRSYESNRDALLLASERAADFVARMFSWERVVDQYVKVLQSLV